jgi:hypothetical protein
MPYLVALLGLIGAAAFWMYRIRMAKDALGELAGVAQDVMAAARRFGFRRNKALHPVENLEDANVAIAGCGIAFLELSGLPTAEQHDVLLLSLQSHLGQDRATAEEAMVLGRWLVAQSGGAAPGLTRLTKRLHRLQGAGALAPLMQVLKDVAASGRDGKLSAQQQEALEDITRTFRLT